MDGGRWGYRMSPAQILDSMLTDVLNDAFSGQHSGWHTEDLATASQVTREAQDGFAARSQQRFAAAQKAGYFAEEIVLWHQRCRTWDVWSGPGPGCPQGA